jgi:hypothetical protein
MVIEIRMANMVDLYHMKNKVNVWNVHEAVITPCWVVDNQQIKGVEDDLKYVYCTNW